MTKQSTMFLGLATLMTMSMIATRQAAAEPLPQGYVSLAGEVGFQLGLESGASLSGGYRIHERPIFLHAQLDMAGFDNISSEAIGSATDAYYLGSSRFVQVRAGAESWSCSTSGLVCGVYGVDLGVLRSGWTKYESDVPVPLRYTEERLVPRGGVDIGGSRIRVRAMAELAVGFSQREQMSSMATTSQTGLQGYGLSAALVVRL